MYKMEYKKKYLSNNNITYLKLKTKKKLKVMIKKKLL